MSATQADLRAALDVYEVTVQLLLVARTLPDGAINDRVAAQVNAAREAYLQVTGEAWPWDWPAVVEAGGGEQRSEEAVSNQRGDRRDKPAFPIIIHHSSIPLP